MIEDRKKAKKKKAMVTFVIAFSIPALTEVVMAVARICIFVYKHYPH